MGESYITFNVSLLTIFSPDSSSRTLKIFRSKMRKIRKVSGSNIFGWAVSDKRL